MCKLQLTLYVKSCKHLTVTLLSVISHGTAFDTEKQPIPPIIEPTFVLPPMHLPTHFYIEVIIFEIAPNYPYVSGEGFTKMNLIKIIYPV